MPSRIIPYNCIRHYLVVDYNENGSSPIVLRLLWSTSNKYDQCTWLITSVHFYTMTTWHVEPPPILSLSAAAP